MRRTQIITAADFYSAANRFTGTAFRDRALIGYEYTALSDAVTLNPLSNIREAWIYFDNENEPELLVPGRVIAKTFNRASFVPVMPSSFHAGTVSNKFSPRADLCPQKLIVDFWSGEVPTTAPTLRHSSVSTQALTISATTAETVFACLRAPNVESIRFWGSNNNQTNTGGNATVTIYPIRPDVRDDQGPRTQAGTPDIAVDFSTTVATITIPGTADGESPVYTARIDHPAWSEYGLTITPPSNAAVHLIVGVEIVWRD